MTPALPDYFALLGLPLQFEVDARTLESAYFKTQRQYHPDRYIGKPASERQQALQLSVDTNNAYSTLKEPYTRAKYLLRLQGIDVDHDHSPCKPSAALLADTMEWREQVQETQTPETLEQLDTQLARLQSEAIGNISQAFNHTKWDAMAQETMRLGYLLKTREEIRQKTRRMKVQA